jgi:hypothetical protein
MEMLMAVLQLCPVPHPVHRVVPRRTRHPFDLLTVDLPSPNVAEGGSRHMKGFLSWGLVPAALLVAASLAQAGPLTDLFNTGVLTNGTLAPGGTVDLHYSLVAAPGGFTTAFVSSTIPTTYQPNGPSSQWIGPDPNLAQVFPGGPPYDYRTTFTIGAGLDPSTAMISGNIASDDSVEVFLNGHDTGVGLPTFTSALTPFSLPTGQFFQAGTNTLDFMVSNSGGGATGLRVEMTGSASVPEPSALRLVVTAALIGLGVLWRQGVKEIWVSVSGPLLSKPSRRRGSG